MRPVTLLVGSIVLGLMIHGRAEAADEDKACVSCHSMMQETPPKSTHPAMTLGCATCHVDHTRSDAGTKNLHSLKAAPDTLCVTCHAELLKKEFVHAPAFQDCTLCHNPHTGLKEGLRAQSNALCLECHSDASKAKFEGGVPVKLFQGRVTAPARYFQGLRLLSLANERGHPVSNHPVLRQADSDWPAVSCTGCHQPHGADKSKVLLVTETESFEPLCQGCHK